ncbi:hypothetical protein TSTA_122400 [Talaromyces stipitatus ATCC 10500]|uniref:Uncharacterized protein n=1 Tax=Talaromyces stipitatus (strain ATCC 10500 / CBS 375.48 / QM 6759 / NRRL 1006) TaxID=441959 RepID=B8MC61_TALSN|nr:uncharacterized protein TSTA_122400 [Talaromyces stipitatus ATCC 10500]EED18507.1 hypothetical protein TSTA_122400 [Talaromyces stipitatus ATCC 10500]
MTFSYDKDVGVGLKMMKSFASKMGVPLNFEGIPAGDVETRRAQFWKMVAIMPASKPSVLENIEIRDSTKKEGEEQPAPGPAVYHVHGGGLILGNIDLSAPPVIREVLATSVPVLTADYSLAPEKPPSNPGKRR